jgi:hypothetical protein
MVSEGWKAFNDLDRLEKAEAMFRERMARKKKAREYKKSLEMNNTS